MSGYSRRLRLPLLPHLWRPGCTILTQPLASVPQRQLQAAFSISGASDGNLTCRILRSAMDSIADTLPLTAHNERMQPPISDRRGAAAKHLWMTWSLQ